VAVVSVPEANAAVKQVISSMNSSKIERSLNGIG